MKVTIKHRPEETVPFVELVQVKADSARDALGFLPSRAYRDAAEQGKLYIAFVESQNQEAYAGHLLFGGVFPKGTVFQLFVDPDYRGAGIARRLVRTIVSRCQAEQYLSITAQVAADLTAASAFWEQLRFKIVRSKAGGASRGRSINVRVRDLETPSLFTALESPAALVGGNLQLVERLTTKSPLYVIDLNVMYDVVKKRLRAPEASYIMNAGFKGLIRIGVTEEFVTELRRTSPSPTNDPILEFALQLPRLPHPPAQALSITIKQLATVVFPHRTAQGSLSTQDQSDLIHLATAIHHKADGFVTSEKALLRARDTLQSTYSLDVVGVVDFAGTLAPADVEHQPTLASVSEGFQVHVVTVKEPETKTAIDFLRQMYVPPQVAADVVSPGTLDVERRRLLVVADDDVIAYASWEAPTGPQRLTTAFICADEDHPAAESVLDYLVDRMSRDVSRSGPTLIRFRELPGHSSTRRVAIAHGFRPGHGQAHTGTMLQKLCVGHAIDEINWQSIAHVLRSLVGIELPTTIPMYRGYQQMILLGTPAGSKIEVSLRDLESILSPALIILPDRNGAIVPIRRTYADDLFGASPQLSLLSAPEAVMLSQRAYFSDQRAAVVLQEGTPVLFYESSKNNGRKSIIAAARIVATDLMLKEDIEANLRRRGVLDADSMQRITSRPTMLSTRFDNILLLRTPVGLRRLRDIGCVNQLNLITAQPIGAQHATLILREGHAHG